MRFVPASARRVVDVGCGSGLFGALLRTAGRTVIGIEPEWELALLARARLNVVLPVPGEPGLEAVRVPVDCVVLADVLEHTSAPQRLLRAAARALGRGERGRVRRLLSQRGVGTRRARAGRGPVGHHARRSPGQGSSLLHDAEIVRGTR